MTKHLLLCLFLSTLALTGCSKDEDSKKPKKMEDLITLQANLAVQKVVDLAGNPIPNAQVLIGTELGKPMSDNFVTTDASGAFQAPSGWTSAQAVTISAPGYVRVTYFGQMPNGQSFKMRPVEGQGSFELGGTTTGFQIRNGDGQVDFSLVIPALERRDLFSFDVSSVISPQNDEITIIGQKVQLPSNITLPKQKESYILPITLEKPLYRMYFKTQGLKKVVALRGQFPLKQVVDEIRANKPFTDVINLFSIKGGSVTNVDIRSGKNQANLPVDTMNFSQSRRLIAPDFGSNDAVLGVSLSADQGLLYPTDFKNLTARQPQNLFVNGNDPVLVTVAKRKSEMEEGHGTDRVSATILPFQNNSQPVLLPLIDDPRMLSGSHIQIPATTPAPGVVPTGTYATLWEVSTRIVGQDRLESLRTTWEVYTSDWAQEIQLPIWPGAQVQAGKMRWGVTLIGQSSTVSGEAEIGPALLETATHATHSSVDF
jgi:hypothetical protein